MEVKVTCACGTSYKFEVEPVNRRMPWPVNCPGCGVDGTAQANDLIRQALAPAQPPAPAAAPPPVVRVSRVASRPEPAPAPPPPAVPPPPPRPVGAPYSMMVEQEPPRSNRAGWIIMACVFLVAAFLGYRLVRTAGNVMSAVSTITDAGDKDGSERNWNLTADNELIVYLKHTNQMEVADECASWFHTKLHRNLRRTNPDEANAEGHEFVVMPPHHGYVQFIADQNELKDGDLEALAGHLSEKFNTLAFAEKDVDFTGAFVFGVYEQGTNHFYARLDVGTVPGEAGEKRMTRGNDWAAAHGFKGGTNGFNKFNIRDADALTQNCGMKLWDRDEESVTNAVLLKEWGMAAGN